MIRGLVIRPAEADDFGSIEGLLDAAFGGTDESRLIAALRRDGDCVLELVATHELKLVGHLLFSRLRVEEARQKSFDAVALAPLAVQPKRQNTGIGTALVENAHNVLKEAGERLSVVLGEPDYYGRFGYSCERAAGFDSDYAGPYLQALAWGKAPTGGHLVYAPAFAGL